MTMNGNSVAVEAKPKTEHEIFEEGRKLAIELYKVLSDLRYRTGEEERDAAVAFVVDETGEIANRLYRMAKGDFAPRTLVEDKETEDTIEPAESPDFPEQQRIAATAFYQAARLRLTVGKLEDCADAAERAPNQHEGILIAAREMEDRLLLIAGEMTDDEGRTCFEVAGAAREDGRVSA